MKFQEFMDDCRARQTKNSYFAAMRILIDTIYGRKISQRIETEEGRKLYINLIDNYLEQDRNFFADLNDYRERLRDKAPKTVRSYMYNCRSVIETCAKYNFTKEKQRKFTGLVRGTKKAITQDAVINHNDIRKIVAHSTIPVRAAIMTMATSGLRIGEILGLKLHDVDFEKRIIYITENVSKTDESRTTFFSAEAGEILNIWLKFRPTYMKMVQAQCQYIRPHYDENDDRLFPMSDSSLRKGIGISIKNAGLRELDRRTKRCTITPHSFRKWYITQLKNVMNPDSVEEMAGHELAYGGAYHRKTVQELEKEYRKHEKVLYIGSDEGMRNTLEAVGSDISALQMRNEYLEREMQQMKETIIQMALNQAGLIKQE